MIIDNVKLNISWPNLKYIILDGIKNIPVKNANIEYNNGIIFTGSYNIKFDIPFSLYITDVAYNNNCIELYIRDISVYMKIPEFLKDLLVRNLIKAFSDKILYRYGTIFIPAGLVKELVPLDEFDIMSLTLTKEGLLAEAGNIKVPEESLDTDLIKGIEDNNSIALEKFDISKAASYCDTIRERVGNYGKSSIPNKYKAYIPYLKIIPDALNLFINLFKNKNVKASDLPLIAAGIVYIISPFDVIPDITLPFGLLDDAYVVFFILNKLIKNSYVDVINSSYTGSVNLVDFTTQNDSTIKRIIPEVKASKIKNLLNSIMDKYKSN